MTIPKAQKKASTFRMECGVSIHIRAPSATVWKLLTHAQDFPRWNSTVTRIDGEIALGQKLTIRVPISERALTPRVTALEPTRRMEWSDGAAPMFKGVRTFTLEDKPDGTTDFTMVEVFSGLMLPLIKGTLPDFGPPFEQYATDLKQESERGH